MSTKMPQAIRFISHTLHYLIPCKHNTRYYSSIIRSPPPSINQAPTPLVFISAYAWDASSHHEVSVTSSALAQEGYTCLDMDVSFPKGQAMTDSSKLMRHFELELKHAIHSAQLAFPPVLVARSSAGLIAQTYISSHPASGLFMISPPASNSMLSKLQLSTYLAEFTYEPKFPIAIMATPMEMEILSVYNRLGKDPKVDKIYAPEINAKSLVTEIRNWLDELGM